MKIKYLGTAAYEAVPAPYLPLQSVRGIPPHGRLKNEGLADENTIIEKLFEFFLIG